MSDELDALDERILDDLAGVYQTLDPVPDGMLDRIKFAASMMHMEAELAQLLSAEPALASRADTYAPVETVTFSSRHLSVMLSVSPAGTDTVRIDGWITGGGVQVELHLGGQVFTTATDANGRFVISDVPHGMAQFVLYRVLPDSDGEPPVLTPSIEV